MRAAALRAAVGVLLASGALAGCSGGDRPAQQQEDVPAAVPLAVEAAQRARALVVDSVDRVVKAAAAVDERDAAAARGDRRAVATIVERTPLDLGLLDKVVASLPVAAKRYGDAVSSLSEVSTTHREDLPAAQQDALAVVVAAAAAEAAEDVKVATSVTASWSTFRGTARAVSTWLTRSRAGWYRDEQEAADAYAVLTADLRAKLERSRRSLRDATDAADRAAAQYGAAVRAFRAVATPTP